MKARAVFVSTVLFAIQGLLLAVPGRAMATGASAGNPFCQRLGSSIQASSGAQMFCFGPQPSGPTAAQATQSGATAPFAPNVNAANPREDVTPAGVRAYGQSETSVAALGPYVVEAWNDATGFLAPCPSPRNKQELTGVGFSANGGASFVDEGGLRAATCDHVYFGDPTVEAWTSGGSTYFYIASLYDRPTFTGLSYLALDACKASGSGSTARLTCSRPIIVAESTECVVAHHTRFCSFLDKEFLTIDPAHGRLYMSYTEFGVVPSHPLFNGQIDLAACDIGTPSGGMGPAGGTAGHPVCSPGRTPSPDVVVSPADPNCESEGAYPATDVASGDVYVGWEFNWASNLFGPSPCFTQKTTDRLARIPAKCLTVTSLSPCTPPFAEHVQDIVSMDGAFIPGYNRFPMNDFPRLAVDQARGTVSMVWNDARVHPTGDILLRSFHLRTLSPVQAVPVRLNPDTGGWHFLPALRNAGADGRLNVTYYQRARGDTDVTNVDGALGVSPLTGSTPLASALVTTVPSHWNSASSDIIPNFGDYTDNYVQAIAGAPFVGTVLHVAWSDGRLGVPQPFAAHAPTG